MQPFTGKIQNVMIVNRALSADEILERYNRTTLQERFMLYTGRRYADCIGDPYNPYWHSVVWYWLHRFSFWLIRML